jgi:hypothetical protein
MSRWKDTHPLILPPNPFDGAQGFQGLQKLFFEQLDLRIAVIEGPSHLTDI